MKKWLTIAVTISLTSMCLAQKTTTKKAAPVIAKQVQKAPIVKFSMIHIEGEKIDPEYNGVSVPEFIDAIEKFSSTKKGEFESTDDFNLRKASALTQKFMGDSSVEDAVAFVVPVSKGVSSYGLKYHFNADTNLLQLTARTIISSLNGLGAPDYQASRRQGYGLDQFDLDLIVNSNKTYQASNAFGASFIVQEKILTRTGIAANKTPFLIYPHSPIKIKIDNAKAAVEVPALKALIVMKPTDPYIVYDFIHSKPTLDSPTELKSFGKYLTGNILGIVFYSGITGEVFARLPENFDKPYSPTIPLVQSISDINQNGSLASNEPGRFEWPAAGALVTQCTELKPCYPL